MTLLAAVIHIEPERALPRWLGRALQAWLLENVKHHDSSLATALHGVKAGASRRPYTASGIRGEQDHFWLRITSVSPPLSALLRDAILPGLTASGGAPLTLAGVSIKVRAVQIEGHAWAGQSDFETLARESFASDPIEAPGFEFATPTAFHRGGLSVPLPVAPLVYGSLIQSWNTLSPVPLPVRLDTFLDTAVGISRHRLSSHSVRFGETEQHIGFTGNVRYMLLPQAKTGFSQLEYSQRLQAIALLTRFAFYVGVGIRTAVGMGQVRPL